MIVTKDIKELVEMFGSNIALYRRIKNIEFTTSQAVSISYIISGKNQAEDKRYLIHLKKLKAACFDELMEHSFTPDEISQLIGFFHKAPLNLATPLDPDLYDKTVEVIKLLTE